MYLQPLRQGDKSITRTINLFFALSVYIETSFILWLSFQCYINFSSSLHQFLDLLRSYLNILSCVSGYDLSQR